MLKKILKSFYYFLFGKIYADMEAKIQALEDKVFILRSGLWDEDFYIRQSGWNRRMGGTPLDHYLTVGWKMGINPSEKFDGNEMLRRKPDLKMNPLVYHLRYGKYPLVNVCKPTDEGVQAYLDAKTKRTAPSKKVVYTCITNGYDDLGEIRCFHYTDPAWDYVCFTDDEELIGMKTFGIWEIRPLQFTNLDKIRNARRHKIQPHKLFPEYDESLWLDANVNILTPFLFEEINRRNTSMLIPMHATRNCLYDEFDFVNKAGIIDQELGQKQIEAYRKAGFPKHYGLHETNIVYRRHNEPDVIAVMDEWLYWIENYTQRDQLSLSFALWKNHFSVASCSFPNARNDGVNFCVFHHRGK
ncbi:MAG: DUF616 domain-containing protein [Thermoguttaceae bacterium]|nr:DUF616 domain-containing protein [Thermoguttaceae bacterium]